MTSKSVHNSAKNLYLLLALLRTQNGLNHKFFNTLEVLQLQVVLIILCLWEVSHFWRNQFYFRVYIKFHMAFLFVHIHSLDSQIDDGA